MAMRFGLAAVGVLASLGLLSASALAQPRSGGQLAKPSAIDLPASAVIAGNSRISRTDGMVIIQTPTPSGRVDLQIFEVRGSGNWINLNLSSSVNSVTVVTLNGPGLPGLLGSVPGGSVTGGVTGSFTTNGILTISDPHLGGGQISIPGATLTTAGAAGGNTTISVRAAGPRATTAKSATAPVRNGVPTAVHSGATTVRDGGLVGLVGAKAADNGVISARLGQVTIGGASAITVDLAGDGLLGLQLGTTTNRGAIKAPVPVAITAATARGVVDSITNVQGMARASGASIDGGTVVFGGTR